MTLAAVRATPAAVAAFPEARPAVADLAVVVASYLEVRSAAADPAAVVVVFRAWVAAGGRDPALPLRLRTYCSSGGNHFPASCIQRQRVPAAETWRSFGRCPTRPRLMVDYDFWAALAAERKAGCDALRNRPGRGEMDGGVIWAR
ncbi:MAG: hypothetical protein JO106_05310 [Mycobacterium sp.]|nr:hypothetical protein [Mycobacterium sp.]